MKDLIWIQGGYGSGKTTQMKMLIESLSNSKPIQIEDLKGDCPYLYTLYKDYGVCVIGKVKENQCTGLDSVYGKLKIEGINLSIQKAIEDDRVNLIIIECVFATYSWFDSWVNSGFLDKLRFYTVHLEMPLWHVYKRIAERRIAKSGQNIFWHELELPDSVYKNAGNKNSETRVVFDKVTGLNPKNNGVFITRNLRIDALLDKETIHSKIIDLLTND